MQINGEDVRCASHEHVVDLIRSSGSLVKMTVVSQSFPNNFEQQMAAQQDQQSFGASVPNRQCATLPRKMGGGRMPAPMPPRRDPKTTLSVGRARAKSMVAGLEGSSIDDEMTTNTKSSSAESIHQSASSTPTQVGPGTPVQLRTASIKARPTSSRITANELEELFQRQQGEVAGQNRYSAMMCSSRFQSGTDSGAATPPSSPQKAPIVYASVAEMKRKKGNKSGTLRGKPCAIPVISTELKRTFHSTPNLATDPSASMSSLWASENGFKGHRSQDDMHSLNVSLQRLNLPPPNHPPPPPPVGQVVKVDVSRGSEYESTLKLQKKLQTKAPQAVSDEIRSSFKPATNAKLYASPQDLRNVAYRTPQSAAPSEPNTATVSHSHFASSGAPFHSLALVLAEEEHGESFVQRGDGLVCWNESVRRADSLESKRRTAERQGRHRQLHTEHTRSRLQPERIRRRGREFGAVGQQHENEREHSGASRDERQQQREVSLSAG